VLTLFGKDSSTRPGLSGCRGEACASWLGVLPDDPASATGETGDGYRLQSLARRAV